MKNIHAYKAGATDTGFDDIYNDIIEAVKVNDIREIKRILANNAEDVFCIDENKMTPLHWAVARNGLESLQIQVDHILRYCAEQGEDVTQEFLELEDIYGRTILDLAVKTNNPLIIEYVSKLAMPGFFDPKSEWNRKQQPNLSVISHGIPSPDDSI